MSLYNYQRRVSLAVPLGNASIGGANPIRLQSMTNTSTNDTSASVDQIIEIAEAGGEIVRLTTQGVKEATNMAAIKAELLRRGCQVPIVADVHFNPKAAYTAAETSDKVRINPGNFVDVARTFKKLEFTDEEYARELERIRAALLPLLATCRRRGVPIRLGVNHGSLSDRIMSRYGDTAAGMTESVMEFLRICREEDFSAVVISIKASNPVVMVETVRLLVERMNREGMAFPIHLGVTEAGDGEDGRIKSAVGIGTLLSEGIGDTIRVSLSESPAAEIPVARKLRDYITSRQGHPRVEEPTSPGRHPRVLLPGLKYPGIAGLDFNFADFRTVNLSADKDLPEELPEDAVIRLTTSNPNRPGALMAYADRLRERGFGNPVVMSLPFGSTDLEDLQVKAGADFGTLLMNGYASAIELVAPFIEKEERDRIALGILQGARLRISKTEYIACPGCGRTLFALQETLRRVREATSHLKGLKIGVMGCIVNGPGEMADADYGYVGAASGKVSLYKNKECIRKNIPEEEAIPALIDLIKSNGDWTEPQPVEK